MKSEMDKSRVIDETKDWIRKMVIGLNLCPFARAVFDANRIRYVVSEATDERTLLRELREELRELADTPMDVVETTLIIHPNVLQDFYSFNGLLSVVDEVVEDEKLRGEIQIASFHPEYRFQNTAPEDVENYTNRSPYPILHLLREQSIANVMRDPEDLLRIPERNIQVLKKMGLANVLPRLKG